MDHIVIDDYKQTKKRWKLYGDHAVVREEDKHILINQVKILIYDVKAHPELKTQVEVVADQGVVESEKELVTLIGNVISKQDPDLSLYTQKAIYDYRKDILYVPENVLIQIEQSTLEGENMTYVLKNRMITLKKASFSSY